MDSIINYVRARKVSMILTIIILLLCSIAYFSTSVAERNNKMMYEKIYGENTTLDSKNNVENTNVVNANSISTNTEVEKVKTALV